MVRVSRGRLLALAFSMEFLNFLLIAATVYLVLRTPDKEQLAFGLLVTSVVLMVFLFLVGTRTSLLPPFNY